MSIIIFEKKHIKKAALIFAAFFIIVICINNYTSFLKKTYPLKYKEFVFLYSTEYEMDPYLIFAVMKAESGFRKDAVSKKGAAGLMQISEKTAKWAFEELRLGTFDKKKLLEPETNIKIGCWYLNKLKKQFNNNLNLILAAYNAGSGNVTQWINDPEHGNGFEVKNIPFWETENYVKNVKKYYNSYLSLYKQN